MKCEFASELQPCWGPYTEYDGFAVCEGHIEMDLTGIYIEEPDWEEQNRALVTSAKWLLDHQFTFTQNQLDSLIAILEQVDSDETRRAIEDLREYWRTRNE